MFGQHKIVCLSSIQFQPLVYLNSNIIYHLVYMFLSSSIFSTIENRTQSIRGAIVESFKINYHSFGFVVLNQTILFYVMAFLYLLIFGIIVGTGFSILWLIALARF